MLRCCTVRLSDKHLTTCRINQVAPSRGSIKTILILTIIVCSSSSSRYRFLTSFLKTIHIIRLDRATRQSNLVDPASSHTLVPKSKPCIIVASSVTPMAPDAALKRDDNDCEDNDVKDGDYEDDYHRSTLCVTNAA